MNWWCAACIEKKPNQEKRLAQLAQQNKQRPRAQRERKLAQVQKEIADLDQQIVKQTQSQVCRARLSILAALVFPLYRKRLEYAVE